MLSHATVLHGTYDYRLLSISIFIAILAAYTILKSAYDRLIAQESRSMRIRLPSAGIRAVQTAILCGLVMVTFEVVKDELGTAMADWTSRWITIAFTSLLAGILSFVILKNEERIRSRLAASDMRYRSLFERSLAGVFCTSLDGRILDCNDAFARILGYTSRQELMGKTSIAFYPSSVEREKVIARLKAEKTLTNFENCLQRRDGSQVWVLANVTLVEGNHLTETVIEGNLTDITERRRTEGDLHRLAAIVRCSDDAIISKNTDGIIETWNRGAERIYGYSAEEVIGQPITILSAPGRANEVRDILAHVREGKEVKQFETVRQQKDGKQINIALTVSPITDAAGKVVGASTIARDITEQKRAQEALRQSELQHRLLFDSCPIPMWVFNKKSLAFLQVNEAAIRHYGYSREEFLSMTILDIRPTEDIPEVLRAAGKVIRGIQETKLWKHRKKNGTIIDVEMVAHDLQFYAVEAQLVAAHDITDRMQAEERIQFLAYFDALTGLPNRTLLHDRLGKALASARRNATWQYCFWTLTSSRQLTTRSATRTVICCYKK